MNYEKCENCFQWNESIRKTVRQEGFCNQKELQEYYPIKQTVVMNEENPRIIFCLSCNESCKEVYYED